MASQDQVNVKRTFYNILQVSDDADIEALTASYLRLKSKYAAIADEAARNELLFIEHAFATLSDNAKRNLYDRQLGNSTSSFVPYADYEKPSESWYTSTKLIAVMIGILAVVTYGLNIRHTEEKGKISVSKEAVVGNNEAARLNAESNYILSTGVTNTIDKSIDRSAEIAARALDIRRQEAEIKKMEAESRIRLNEASIQQRNEAKQEADDRAERCQYMRTLVNQANRAGLYEEARALQARGC